MNPLSRWTRTALAVAAILAASLGATAPAGAAPKRTADTSTYTSNSYLQQALGLPAKPKLVIESVTYDRFQWLLQQEGKFAFLIGDPATDATFADRAQQVESAASDAGVKQVYWFNPNLSGNAKLGDVTQPNLDVRNPAGITSLAPTKAAIVGNAWLNLIGQYLGNGIKANPANQNTGSATVTTAPDATVVNDYGANAGYSTKVGNTSGGALFQYTAGVAPADVSDSFFFLYDKDNEVTPVGSSTPEKAKIIAWVNLTDSATPLADVTTAIATCGAANIKAIDEFTWWKSSNNAKQIAQSPNEHQGAGIPNLTDADGAAANGGWRVHQVTYPELVHLLKTEQAKEAVILFGGTWCPNTRPVLPSINRYAQENDVTVFNFDTILDGGVVGGGNAPSNPLQSRNPASNGGFLNANPSFLYGELVSRFLNNLKTEYKPDAGNRITYYPGGDATQELKSQPRLQVPYLYGYKGQATTDPFGGVVRQWIHDLGTRDIQDRPDYKEYMSVWHFTNPQPGQLGVAPGNLLRQTQAWATINSQLPSFTWQTDLSMVKANTGIDTDAAQFLTPTEKAKVTFTPPDTLAVAADASGIDANAEALSAALSALGGSAPANYAAARAALIAEESAVSPDETRRGHLRTVVGAWGISQQRKNTVNTLWGDAATPGSIAGGIAAVRAAEVFFAGLPDRPGTPGPDPDPDPDPTATASPAPTATATATPAATSTPIATAVPKGRVRTLAGSVAKRPTSRKRGKYRVKITVPAGRPAATGTITVKLKKGRRTRTLTGTLRNGAVTIPVPKLGKGTWKVTISWTGDATYQAEEATGKLKVKK